jgi:hypothetical protein
MGLLTNILAAAGLVRVEKTTPALPDVLRADSAAAIGQIFRADAKRHQLDHKTAMRGGPRIASNATDLGRHGRGLFRTVSDWLR